jgi:hypothetical protein
VKRVLGYLDLSEEVYTRLVRSKPTASGRVTQRASSDPACIVRNIRPGLDIMRVIHEWPPPSDRESPLPSDGDGLGLLAIHAPNGVYLT